MLFLLRTHSNYLYGIRNVTTFSDQGGKTIQVKILLRIFINPHLRISHFPDTKFLFIIFEIPFEIDTNASNEVETDSYGIISVEEFLTSYEFKVKSVLQCYHDNHGHLGFDKTEALIRDNFIWDRMKMNISIYLKNCKICMQQCSDHKRRDKGVLRPLDVPEQLFEQLEYGFYTQVTRNGKGWYVSERLALIFFSDIFKNYGMPKEIISEQDPIFMSKIWRAVMKKLGVKHETSLSYHHSANVKAGEEIDVEDYIDSNGLLDVDLLPKNWLNHLDIIEFVMVQNVLHLSNCIRYHY
eukprot:gene3548-4414_t